MNVVRHAQAATAVITLDYAPDAVTLTVRDDGRGFVVPRDLNDLVMDGHYGLMGLRERASALHGAASVDSSLGHGTTVTVRIPADIVTYDAARDPVCGTLIASGRAYNQTTYHGRVYTFCCPVCQGAFEADPERYIAAHN